MYQYFNEVEKGCELAEALNAQGFKQPLVDKLMSNDTRANDLASLSSILLGENSNYIQSMERINCYGGARDVSTRRLLHAAAAKILTAQPPSSREDRGYDRSTFCSLRDLCRGDAVYQRNLRLFQPPPVQ